MAAYHGRQDAFPSVARPRPMPFEPSTGTRQYSSACERNRQPILEVLLRLLPSSGQALEIASGTGQHVAWFARHLAGWRWQPSDCVADTFASIAAWCDGSDEGLAPLQSVAAPIVLDVLDDPWPLAADARFDLMLATNMLHIAPWPACAALMRGAARHLAPGGLLVTYGPYLEDDRPAAPSNLEFDDWLRRRDPDSGLRRREDVVGVAERHGLILHERVEMPANNLMLVFARRAVDPPAMEPLP